VQKTYSRTFNCNKTNRDIFNRLRTHYPQFANFNGNFGPGGLARASISFGSALITKGAIIPIHNVNSGPTAYSPAATFDIAVKVATVSTMAGRSMGFSFDTLPGHVLYPASISFFAVQGDQGSVNFSINVNGNFSSTINKELFNHAGGDELENKIWNNIDRQRRKILRSRTAMRIEIYGEVRRVTTDRWNTVASPCDLDNHLDDHWTACRSDDWTRLSVCSG